LPTTPIPSEIPTQHGGGCRGDRWKHRRARRVSHPPTWLKPYLCPAVGRAPVPRGKATRGCCRDQFYCEIEVNFIINSNLLLILSKSGSTDPDGKVWLRPAVAYESPQDTRPKRQDRASRQRLRRLFREYANNVDSFRNQCPVLLVMHKPSVYTSTPTRLQSTCGSGIQVPTVRQSGTKFSEFRARGRDVAPSWLREKKTETKTNGDREVSTSHQFVCSGVADNATSTRVKTHAVFRCAP
jgi:hypothetical protein